jgi:hypothetical protein
VEEVWGPSGSRQVNELQMISMDQPVIKPPGGRIACESEGGCTTVGQLCALAKGHGLKTKQSTRCNMKIIAT